MGWKENPPVHANMRLRVLPSHQHCGNRYVCSHITVRLQVLLLPSWPSDTLCYRKKTVSERFSYRVRFRWYLAYTLLRNPQLRRYRYRFMVEQVPMTLNIDVNTQTRSNTDHHESRGSWRADARLSSLQNNRVEFGCWVGHTFAAEQAAIRPPAVHYRGVKCVSKKPDINQPNLIKIFCPISLIFFLGWI